MQSKCQRHQENERLPRAPNNLVSVASTTKTAHTIQPCGRALWMLARVMWCTIANSITKLQYRDIKNEMYVAQHYFSAQFTSRTMCSLYKYEAAQDKRAHKETNNNENKKEKKTEVWAHYVVVAAMSEKNLCQKYKICKRRASAPLQTTLNDLKREWLLYTSPHSHANYHTDAALPHSCQNKE